MDRQIEIWFRLMGCIYPISAADYPVALCELAPTCHIYQIRVAPTTSSGGGAMVRPPLHCANGTPVIN
jgi:hypothetical protein